MKSKIENSRVLVTGRAGFIGFNIIEKLLLQNNEVICSDNFSTSKRENIELFLQNKSFILVEGDIRNLKQCEKVVDGIDYVIHQAALPPIQMLNNQKKCQK